MTRAFVRSLSSRTFSPDWRDGYRSLTPSVPTRAALLAAAGAILGAAALGYRSSGVWVAITLAAAATAASMLWRARERWSPGAVASLAERGIPESHNVIFTARELLGSAVESAPWMQRRVVERAASIVERASVPAIVPVGRDIFWLGIAAIVLAAIAFGMPQRVARLRSATAHRRIAPLSPGSRPCTSSRLSRRHPTRASPRRPCPIQVRSK